MGTRSRPSRICVLQSQHSRCKRRRLLDMSRTDRQYAGCLSGKYAPDGMVSRVSSRARKVHQAEVRDLQHAVAGWGSYGGGTDRSEGKVQDSRQRNDDELFDLSQVRSCRRAHREVFEGKPERLDADRSGRIRKHSVSSVAKRISTRNA